MSDKFYYSHPNVSASNLKELKREYYNDTRDLETLYREAFIVGSIVDVHLTEDGRPVEGATKELYELAMKLVKYMRADPIIARLLTTMKGQFRFFKLIEFEFEGTVYRIRAKCKFDGFSMKLRIAVEYKTTSCTTENSFIASIEFLDYDLSAAWYMDIAKIDRLWIIAISKKNFKIFKFAIQRGDETYNRGKAKYTLWAYRWVTLIFGFVNYTLLTYEAEEIRAGNELLASNTSQHADQETGEHRLSLLSGIDW